MNRTFLATLVAISGLKVASAMTFHVTNTNDSGAGSFRQAITDANNNGGADTIDFQISGAGQKTITITSAALPDILDSVTIDGGNNGVASNRVEISGGGGFCCGLAVNGSNANGSEIRNLVINGFTTQQILTTSTSDATIKGCFLGLNPAGTAIVSGSGEAVEASNAGGLNIGGTTTTERNVMSATNGNSILNLNGSSPTVRGNYIGLNKAGTAALGNPGVGVFISNGGGTIGGTNPNEGNVIVAFTGVNFGGNPALGHSSGSVQGNFIGTNAVGDTALNLNNGSGVAMVHARNVLIEGNVISGNGDGVTINQSGISGTTSSTITVQGNFIGTAADGLTPLGNTRSGIDNNCPNNTIGGTGPGEGNVIAFNGQAGVHHRDSTGNPTLGNSIFSNGGLGIDLDLDGPTPNDDDDPDTGANNLQNFPVLTSVSNSGGMTTITGRFNSAPSTVYRLEFFANDAINSTGYGEGKTFIGSMDVPTNAGGNKNFTAMFPQIAAGQRVTATATDPNGNTSEFSGAIGQLLNVSTRMEVLTGGSVLIGGFIIGGSGNMDVLLRALGPTLQQFGINDFLADPTLDLFNGVGTLLKSNDNWKENQQAEIQATGKAPPNDLESAIRQSLLSGSYTAIVRGKNQTTGIGLVEAYDLDGAVGITLTNISTRGFVDTGQNVMIGGVISGNGIVRVIVRALGPTLTQFGVPTVLADPVLDVRDAQGTSLATNDNWKDTQQAEIQASGKAPPNDNESAIIIVRPAANTTAIVSGKGGTTGNALVEAYILPP
jgi:hypothetical protein